MTLVSVRTTQQDADVTDSDDGGFPVYDATGPLVFGTVTPRDIGVALLFEGINVSGTVDDAKITFEDSNFGAGGQVETNITGDDSSGSPGVFSDGDGPWERTETTTSVVFNYTPPSGTTYDTPALEAIFQELVNSYTTLTNAGIFVKGDGGSTLNHDSESFDDDSAKAPLLTLNYTAAAGGADHRALLLMGVG